MTIEKEIQQKKFKSDYQKALISITYTANFLGLQVMTALKPYGITPEQFNVLRILRGQFPSPSTVNLIIERMLNKSSNASRLVEKLRVKGLVERIECPEDRRAVNILITKKGLELLERLDKEEDEWLNSVKKKLTATETKELIQILDKIRK
jgi:DNA-binding MarR family transcriptional regulator